jgi:hypothetical protein
MNPFNLNPSAHRTMAAKKSSKKSLTGLAKFESLGAHTESILSK